MKKLLVGLALLATYLVCPTPIQAASSDISTYTTNTLQIITIIAIAATSLFLVYSGYLYITSAGKPDALEHAKTTLRNAIVGLVMVLAAGSIISIFQSALNPPTQTVTTPAIDIAPITSVKPNDGLTQVMIDTVTSFAQNILESGTQPIVDGIFGYVTTTPSVLSSSAVTQLWLISLGIVDSLFVLVVALLGLHVMSASTFGFEELNIKQLLPRIGLAFLGANISLFLSDYVIVTCNALVNAMLHATGGLNHAWITNAINPASLATGNTPLITIVFLILFLILAIVLLLMYISRLILISLSAVLSPFIFLLWAIPKCADVAEMAIKTYLVTVFTIFVHVVIIQLAASFLSLPATDNGSLISIAVAIGLFATLLKTPSLMMQLVTYTSHMGVVQKMGGQMMNMMSTTSTASEATKVANPDAKVPREVKYI